MKKFTSSQHKPPRVTGYPSKLDYAGPLARFWFRLTSVPPGKWGVTKAWNRVLANDDPSMAVALLRHGLVPEVSDEQAHYDSFCSLLRQATSLGRRDRKPFAKDPLTGLTVIGSMLVAGANPASTEINNCWDSAIHHAARGNLPEFMMMVEMGTDLTVGNSLNQTPVDCLLERAAQSMEEGAVSRSWKLFLETLSKRPACALGDMCDVKKLLEFALKSGNQGILEHVLTTASPQTIQDLLWQEVASSAKPSVLSILTSHGASWNAPQEHGRTLLAKLLTYEYQSDFGLDRYSLLADKVGNLDALDDDGNTLTHLLIAASSNVDKVNILATLRSCGLPDQATHRNNAGLTPLELFEKVAREQNWSLSDYERLRPVLLAQDRAASLEQRLVAVARSSTTRRRP